MLPEAFLERMQGMLGEEYEAFLETFEQERSQALRLNPLKYDEWGRSAVERYGGNGGEAGFASLEKVAWAEDGYYYQPSDQPGKHPFHEAGLYYIQEPSAMAPAELLGVKPGEKILDLCAAPGGKTAQIAAKLRGRGLLFCNEIHPARAKILSENIERLGICNACVTNEAPEELAGLFSGFFDRILVDAPCSGEGMFRKNEAACREWSPENVALCARRQDGILDCAAGVLRPGGRLVYSTCTFAPEENEGTVSRFLRRHGDFHILQVDKAALGLEGCDGMPEYGRESGMEVERDPADVRRARDGAENGPEYEREQPADVKREPDSGTGLEDTLRLWPQRIRGEGHFAAVLQKKGEPRDEERSNVALYTVEKTAAEAWKGFAAFCEENLCLGEGSRAETGAGRQDRKRRQEQDAEVLLARVAGSVGLEGGARCIVFGENLYLIPAEMPSLRGLKVLRPGLHLGALKKNRFEPSHALALALRPETAAYRWELSAGSPEGYAYLNGETFPAEGEKGWYLICVDGFSAGWGKLAGGVMKNHYPKGLRKRLT